MDKLKLDLDDLEVESFQTAPSASAQQGTVHGYAESRPGVCVTCQCRIESAQCGLTSPPECGPSEYCITADC